MADCNSCPSKGKCTSKDACTIKNNPNNHVKKVIGVMSGKGGVGKSTVTALLAKALNSAGSRVGVLDADITGPSIPRLLGVKDKKVEQGEFGLIPVQSKEGIAVMSLNLLLQDERQPVIWRGPIISGTVKQFWEDVFWGDLDVLLVDMPPGTGDVALTVMQSMPLSGMLMVTVPQDMVSMIVAKAVNMVKALNIPLLGVVRNMSYLNCPHCGEKISLFGRGDAAEFYDGLGLDLLGELPMKDELASLTDDGIQAGDAEIDVVIERIAQKIAEV